jgi:hypothetical protein
MPQLPRATQLLRDTDEARLDALADLFRLRSIYGDRLEWDAARLRSGSGTGPKARTALDIQR